MVSRSPVVSVILPCYNASSTLNECLHSLRAQDFDDYELILFDDGSTDNSAHIAQVYADEDQRVRILSHGHAGLVDTLIKACASARGSLLARMDSDDVAHPQRLSKQVAYMKAHPEVALCGTRVEIIGDGLGSGIRRYENWINSLITPEDMRRDLFVECPIPHPTFMVDRKAFEKVGGYRPCEWAEDYDLVMRLHCAGYAMGKVEEALLKWRHSASRLSMSDPRYTLKAFRELRRHYLDKTYLKNGRAFFQWGAGDVGKRWLREWPAGRRPTAVVDIDPRKIGQNIHGVPVIAAEDLPQPGEAMTLVAVGAPGARTEIRAWFADHGHEELRDFSFIA